MKPNLSVTNTAIYETTIRHFSRIGSAFLRLCRGKLVTRRDDIGISPEALRTTRHRGRYPQPDCAGTGQGDGRER